MNDEPSRWRVAMGLGSHRSGVYDTLLVAMVEEEGLTVTTTELLTTVAEDGSWL